MSVTPEQITLGMQIAAVEREIAMRRQVYPRQVGQGKMNQATADLQIAAMEAVLVTLRRLGDDDLRFAEIRSRVQDLPRSGTADAIHKLAGGQ